MRNITVWVATPVLAILFTLSIFVTAKAQSKHLLSNSTPLSIQSYKVLPDKNHSFSQILNDKNLQYQDDSLRTAKHDSYWVKIGIENPYPDDENYTVKLSFLLDYTVYFLDPTTKKWISRYAGGTTVSPYRKNGMTSVTLRRRSTSTIYLKIDLHNLPQRQFNFKPTIYLTQETLLQHEEDRLRDRVLMSCIVLLCLIAYNFYIYLYLKDKTYLFFLTIQFGAIIFLLSARNYFNLLLPIRIHNVKAVSPTLIIDYEINLFLQHIGILTIIWGVTNFVRAYLSTPTLLPRLDRILKFMLYGYASLEIISSVTTLSGLFYLDYYTFVYNNLYIQSMLLAILIIAIIAYRKRIPAAKYFLFANILPIILVLATCIYSIATLRVNPILPEIAIFSQILTFAVSLVARLKIVSAALNEKQIEAIDKEHLLQIAAFQQIEIEQKSARVIKTEQHKNEKLISEVEAHQREIVSNQIYIQQKKSLLIELAKQVDELNLPGLNNIQSSLRHDDYINEYWGRFKLHFEQMHPNFFDDLKTKNDKLTQGELRLSAYLQLNLSTKEIAALLNILPTSVKQARSRLNKKLKN